MYDTVPAAAGWQHNVLKVGAGIDLLNEIPALELVVRGDDFIVAGVDSISQRLHQNLDLVQKARLGRRYDSEAIVLNRCVDVQRHLD